MTRAAILHVVVAGDVGGAERVVLDLVQASQLNGSSRPHLVAVVTHNPALRAFLGQAGASTFQGPEFSERPLGYARLSFGGAVSTWVAELATRVQAGVVHLHTFAAHVVGTRAAVRAGLPVVRTEHSSRIYDDATCWTFSRWSLVRTQAVVAVSQHIRDVALARAPWLGDRITVVPNGVALPAEVPPRVRAPGAPHRFAIVARLEPRKGADLALHALVHVPEAELVIGGEGPEGRVLEALAERLGVAQRVRFTGWCATPGAFMADADTVLVPSRTEGLSLVALEAMAAGRPVVARAVGALPEVIDPGVTGWLAADASVEALAAAMRTAMANEASAAEMGRAGRARVAARFSLPAMVAGYEAVYRRVCEAGAGATG